MDTNFNTVIYQLEMLSLVNTAIKKLKAEHPDYEVFTMSLTTDFASGVSAVHFDSRASSERYLKKEAEQYQKYLQAGNLSMAEMYAPIKECPEITVTWFRPDEKKDGGQYITTTGRLRRIDEFNQVLILVDDIKIPLTHVVDLDSEKLPDMNQMEW